STVVPVWPRMPLPNWAIELAGPVDTRAGAFMLSNHHSVKPSSTQVHSQAVGSPSARTAPAQASRLTPAPSNPLFMAHFPLGLFRPPRGPVPKSRRRGYDPNFQ